MTEVSRRSSRVVRGLQCCAVGSSVVPLGPTHSHFMQNLHTRMFLFLLYHSPPHAGICPLWNQSAGHELAASSTPFCRFVDKTCPCIHVFWYHFNSAHHCQALYTHIHISIYMHIYIYIYICVYMCMYVYTCTYVCVCVCIYMCIYVYMYTYIYINIYVYM